MIPPSALAPARHQADVPGSGPSSLLTSGLGLCECDGHTGGHHPLKGGRQHVRICNHMSTSGDGISPPENIGLFLLEIRRLWQSVRNSKIDQPSWFSSEGKKIMRWTRLTPFFYREMGVGGWAGGRAGGWGAGGGRADGVGGGCVGCVWVGWWVGGGFDLIERPFGKRFKSTGSTGPSCAASTTNALLLVFTLTSAATTAFRRRRKASLFLGLNLIFK